MLNFFRVFVFFNLSNSSLNENFMHLKIMRSVVAAPIPPINPTSQMFEGFKVMKNPTANGAENPKAINIPAMKIPR